MPEFVINPPANKPKPLFYLGTETGSLFVRTDPVGYPLGALPQPTFICIVAKGGLKVGQEYCDGAFTPILAGSTITITT